MFKESSIIGGCTDRNGAREEIHKLLKVEVIQEFCIFGRSEVNKEKIIRINVSFLFEQVAEFLVVRVDCEWWDEFF